MSARETLIAEIELLPEPMIDEALRLISHTFRQNEKPASSPDSGITHPLKFYPELAGQILYDPTEPATEEDWPAAAR